MHIPQNYFLRSLVIDLFFALRPTPYFFLMAALILPVSFARSSETFSINSAITLTKINAAVGDDYVVERCWLIDSFDDYGFYALLECQSDMGDRSLVRLNAIESSISLIWKESSAITLGNADPLPATTSFPQVELMPNGSVIILAETKIFGELEAKALIFFPFEQNRNGNLIAREAQQFESGDFSGMLTELRSLRKAQATAVIRWRLDDASQFTRALIFDTEHLEKYIWPGDFSLTDPTALSDDSLMPFELLRLSDEKLAHIYRTFRLPDTPGGFADEVPVLVSGLPEDLRHIDTSNISSEPYPDFQSETLGGRALRLVDGTDSYYFGFPNIEYGNNQWWWWEFPRSEPIFYEGSLVELDCHYPAFAESTQYDDGSALWYLELCGSTTFDRRPAFLYVNPKHDPVLLALENSLIRLPSGEQVELISVGTLRFGKPDQGGYIVGATFVDAGGNLVNQYPWVKLDLCSQRAVPLEARSVNGVFQRDLIGSRQLELIGDEYVYRVKRNPFDCLSPGHIFGGGFES